MHTHFYKPNKFVGYSSFNYSLGEISGSQSGEYDDGGSKRL
jgi:hypothetical protein